MIMISDYLRLRKEKLQLSSLSMLQTSHLRSYNHRLQDVGK